MAIKHPLLLILLPILILLYLHTKKEKKEKKVKTKIANTFFVKNSEYYKKILKNYQTYKTILYLSFIVAIISSILLISRIQKVEVNNIDEYKRDIMLCMDVSGSVDQLNIETIENLKKTVNSLKGERFGISIFNTTSVLVAPLTDDYDYITETLDEIEKSIKANNGTASQSNDANYIYTRNYINSGTIEGHEARGSSLIGDGLASCIYSFPKIEEERTRIIIFTTDNDLAGTPIVTLEKAAEISKSKNIPVYGIGTKQMKDTDRSDMKKAVEKTGGIFYQQSEGSVKDIVNNIEKTSKSLIHTKTQTKETDLPTIPFLLLFVSLGIILISSKKVMV